MSNYPTSIDNDTTLPAVNDNINEIGGDAINALRDAVFQIETALGTNIQGSVADLATRLGVFINPDGTPNASIITALGLITLPIYDNQIAAAAGIEESKLALDYPTANLFNYIRDLSADVNLAIGWINVTGMKLEPHLIGAIYRHDLAQIDVAEVSAQFLNNKFAVPRDNSNAYTAINDMNNELLAHQWADGSNFGIIHNVVTNDGSIYPSNYAHVASGIYLDTARFSTIPQTTTDVQLFAEYMDTNSLFLLGTRIQNLYANGISRNSRSSRLVADGYGQFVVPVTPAIAFLRGAGDYSTPIDDIAQGDDIIQFLPSATSLTNNVFDAQFAQVKPGDICTINYVGDGYNIEVPFVISEKKYVQDGVNKLFIVRIAGKNIAYSPNSTARINRPLYNNNKYGELAISAVNTAFNPSGTSPSLIIGAPRGAQCTGIGFSPDQFNETHYMLYLALYLTGNPLDGYTILPGIDVTGNLGITPGAYTLDSIVEATNSAFRQPGYNYRFIAFQYKGEFGVMLADSYNNVSFSVITGVINSLGNYDTVQTPLHFPNNVVDVLPAIGLIAPDPLGFGPFGAGVASPVFNSTYSSIAAAAFPTKLFVPLKRNNYYVNGNELELFALDVSQTLDNFGDGYWIATVDGYSAIPGSPGHTTVTYNIDLDLSASNLKPGMTIVVQPQNTNYGLINYGRFIIQSVNFSCCPPVTTQITVFDGIHANGSSPPLSQLGLLQTGEKVAIYFNTGSVTFDNETATDFTTSAATFKRHFEVYIDGNGKTFTHERGRLSTGGTIAINGVNLYSSLLALGQFDIVRISPKLTGYQVGSVNKVTLFLSSFDPVAGKYVGYLAYNSPLCTQLGPTTTGIIGETTRFYDNTNIDFIDVFADFSITSSIPVPVYSAYIDVQLFPSLALDEEVMLIASCQETNDSRQVTYIQDLRQFGNVSEQELTTSALDYIALPERLLHFNGVIRGFDITLDSGYENDAMVSLTGGLALVNGNFESINDQILTLPPLQEVYSATNYPINYALCANSDGELVTIVLRDYDPILVTPNNPNRLVTVHNLATGNLYQIDSATFSYILNDRKDLTVLYIVSANASGSGVYTISTPYGATTSISNIRDVRRYVNDTDSSIIPTVTTDNSQGNFKNFASAINWLKFNYNFENEVKVKGTYTISTDYEFYNMPQLQVYGDLYNTTLNINYALYISGVTFNNINIVVNSQLNINTSSSNLTGPVVFNNCNMVLNETLTVNNLSSLQSNFVQFNNCTVVVNTVNGFIIGSNVSFNNCNITYNYDATSNSNFNSAIDSVNDGQGLIYSATGFNQVFENVNIIGCEFISTYANRFSFIDFQATDYTSIIQNIIIKNNQFISQIASSNEDGWSAISIISTINVSGSGTQTISGAVTYFPQLVNVIIDNNICNQDQGIVISNLTKQTSGANQYCIVGAPFQVISSRITNNVCGGIGFITADGYVADFNNNGSVTNIISIMDKSNYLLIANNTAHFIGNVDSKLGYLPFGVRYGFPFYVNYNTVQIATGQIDIIGNTVNWISVGAKSMLGPVNNGKGVNILNNKLVPGNTGSNNYIYNWAYNIQLDLFNGDFDFYYYYYPNGIQLLPDTYGHAGITNSVISGNILCQDSLKTITGTASGPYYYDIGIYVANNANVTNNVIDAVISTSFGSDCCMIRVGDSNSLCLVSDNNLNRNGQTINTYINGSSGIVCTIKNNIFDSLYTDSANSIFNNVNCSIPQVWAYHHNTNQVGFSAVPLYDYFSTVGNPPGFYPFVGGNAYGGAQVNGSLTTAMLTNDDPPSPWTWQPLGRLSDMLPADVKLLYVAFGVCMVPAGPEAGTILSATGSYISISLIINQTDVTNALPVAPSAHLDLSNSSIPLWDSILDISNVPNTDTSTYSPTSATFPLTVGYINEINDYNTRVLLMDMTASGAPPVYTNKGYETMVSINFVKITPDDSGPIEIDMSPIIFRYAWA